MIINIFKPHCPICKQKLIPYKKIISINNSLFSNCKTCNLQTTHAQFFLNFLNVKFAKPPHLQIIDFFINNFKISYSTYSNHSTISSPNFFATFPFNPIKNFHKLHSLTNNFAIFQWFAYFAITQSHPNNTKINQTTHCSPSLAQIASHQNI